MDDLYRDILIEQAKNPQHYGDLRQYDLTLPASNVSCGDKLTFQVKLADPDDQTQSAIIDLKWQGAGCLVSRASADLLAEYALANTLSVNELSALTVSQVLELLGLDEITPAREKCLMLGVSAFKPPNRT